ncbi:hypothetical protein DFJ73DRAFT_864923 [Zopfochytrium polystomum]|nr:hypothetical protein DFJ73DRAFT_879389 [Zopfochytrium polystomum]KAI9326938.1 hypothetical protein DFJ73DRAFT_864923 [Zopfochytrium polystomum]
MKPALVQLLTLFAISAIATAAPVQGDNALLPDTNGGIDSPGQPGGRPLTASFRQRFKERLPKALRRKLHGMRRKHRYHSKAADSAASSQNDGTSGYVDDESFSEYVEALDTQEYDDSGTLDQDDIADEFLGGILMESAEELANEGAKEGWKAAKKSLGLKGRRKRPRQRRVPKIPIFG